MHTFTFYIEDRRYTVSDLMFVTLRDEGRAREVAAQKLAASPNHLSVEVREEDRLLFVLSRARAMQPSTGV
jgi:hypothetical protein